MKSAGKWLAVLVLVSIIGFVLWSDWIRQPVAPEPPAPVPAVLETEIVGIGAVLRRDEETGLLQLAGTLPNSPAMKAGLTVGLVILKVDNTVTEGLPLKDCVELVPGGGRHETSAGAVEPGD